MDASVKSFFSVACNSSKLNVLKSMYACLKPCFQNLLAVNNKAHSACFAQACSYIQNRVLYGRRQVVQHNAGSQRVNLYIHPGSIAPEAFSCLNLNNIISWEKKHIACKKPGCSSHH